MGFRGRKAASLEMGYSGEMIAKAEARLQHQVSVVAAMSEDADPEKRRLARALVAVMTERLERLRDAHALLGPSRHE